MATPLVADRLYEFVIFAELEGQAHVNVLHYKESPASAIGAGDTMEAAILVLIDTWRTEIVARVSNKYRVLTYSLQEILENRTPIVPTPLFKPFYRRQEGIRVIENGDVSDVGGYEGGHNLPSLVAANFRKIAISTQRWARGSVRIGGWRESYTEMEQANRWTGAAMTALGDVGGELLSSGLIDTTELLLQVFGQTTWLGDSAPGAAIGSYTSRVTQCIPSPWVSSQVSRKERLNLG